MRLQRWVIRRLAFALLMMVPILLAGCGGGSGTGTPVYTRNVVVQWDDTMLQAISAVKPGPPMTARAIGIVHTCMFDAWAAYDSAAVGTRSGGLLRRPPLERTLANKQKAISYAAYRALVDLYPTQKSLFEAKMAALGYDPADASKDTATAAGMGNTCAAAVITFRHSDGSNQLGDLHPGAYSDTTGYVPVNTPDLVTDPSQWQQLRFSNGASPTYIGAQWGNVIPFALTSPSEFRPVAPPVFGSPQYLTEAQQIVDYTANLTDEQKVIAEYWADGPSSVLPPGHWCLFAQYISQRDNHDLDTDVKMFFLVSNAVMDAGIACWDCKRVYNTSRPITAIRFLYKGKSISDFAGPNNGDQIIDGSSWVPYQLDTFITPPFPEYVSGHSTFSAAAAEVLKRFTGSDAFGNSATFPVGWSKFENGVPAKPVTLTWATFTDAANQAGLSRLYGGIHFQSGNQMGLQLGRQVGAQVWLKGNEYINGTAKP